MIDTFKHLQIIVDGLEEYLKSECPSCNIRMQNTTEEIPKFPYVAYNITTLSNENKGTYGEYEDGMLRKPHIQTWSITANSDDRWEAIELSNKAHEWLDNIGTTYLNDNNVIVQSVGSITDRSNLLTVDYMYSYGFDCFFWLYDETENPIKNIGYIEKVEY